MMDIVIGQRWVSHTEQNLGLGIIQEISGRLVTIDFPAAEEQRTYARDNAPISRIIYSAGEQITVEDGNAYEIIEVLEEKGLVGYLCRTTDGNEQVVPEVALNSHVHFTTPRQRLMSGQFDGNSAFRLRHKTLVHMDKLARSDLTGLSAGRMELLPHQIYIAHEVAKRYAPRVLLADEVGLGKTIEAAMIIHHQLLQHQAQRVLILVPESLMHQWFVELLRRFNLHFSLLNSERLNDAMVVDEDMLLPGESVEPLNPFDMEQLVITSLDICNSEQQFKDWLLTSEWDMLVVDEAHHLTWSESHASEEYQVVEQLAKATASVLLLTATPEQVGAAGHFARLRLLDPQRYSELDLFLTEEQDYKSLNASLEVLEDLLASGENDIDRLMPALKQQVIPHLYQKLEQLQAEDGEQMLQQLPDLHGTGRVLFRNQRAHISGFPNRHVHPIPLPGQENPNAGIAMALYPEQAAKDEGWLETDPRVRWLIDFLRANKRAKILVICHHDETALALDKHLNLREGIRTTAFVPELSIVERDRAAAYFADPESGAQALICSEIGSEGRNFQFAQDLVLFDLPLNPDLVEQRIGRLDRIGQQADIHLHIPYLQNTAQEVLYRWYHEGLNLFAQTASAGYAIFRHFQTRLEGQLRQRDDRLEMLVADTKTYRIKLNHELQEGKDRLLERNSCNPILANNLIKQLQEEQLSDELQDYMMKLFEEYGVETETHSEQTWIVKPSEQMREQHFPGLKDDGQTITFSRERAIEREDYDFLTWEHPMVNESMEAIRDSELGNAAVATIKVKGLQPGTLLLESCYTISTSAPKNLQIERYLGLSPLRLLTDIRGKNLSHVVSHDALNSLTRRLPKEVSRKACQQLRGDIDQLIRASAPLLEPHLVTCKQQAVKAVNELLGAEISRLQQLARLNPNIRQSEIDYFSSKQQACLKAIEQADIQLQALRLLIIQ